tara:strand:+ start:655 stop:1050 length:396 start_codon:yes stop_codon:yes gene_type:complete
MSDTQPQAGVELSPAALDAIAAHLEPIIDRSVAARFKGLSPAEEDLGVDPNSVTGRFYNEQAEDRQHETIYANKMVEASDKVLEKLMVSGPKYLASRGSNGTTLINTTEEHVNLVFNILKTRRNYRTRTRI